MNSNNFYNRKKNKANTVTRGSFADNFGEFYEFLLITILKPEEFSKLKAFIYH